MSKNKTRQTAKKNKQINQGNPSNRYILPIAFVITVVPLIVFLKVVNLTPAEIKNYYGQPTYADFFSYYKSQWLIIGTAMAAISYLTYSIIKGFKLEKNIIYIPIITYAVLIILSTITSDDPIVALRGFVSRCEGMWVLLCYLALLFITYNLVKSESQIRFLLGGLLISATIIGIIGVFQFIKLDIFRTCTGKLMILPEAYHSAVDSINFTFPESHVYSTFSNTNYMGSYVPLVIPVVFAALLYFKKPLMKIGTGLLLIILLICLYGSRSSAGVVGLCGSVIIALVLYRKQIWRRKLVSLIVLIFIVLASFGINSALEGGPVDMVVSEYNKIVEDMSGVTQSKYFDLQDILFEENTVSIVSGTETLTVEINEEAQLNFYDDNGNVLKTNITPAEKKATVKFEDEKYKDYTLTIQGPLIMVYNKRITFKLQALQDKSFQFIGINGDVTNKIEKAEALGFTGKEKLGSKRGYIWSRTLPLLKDALVWGYGPDICAIAFPQNDYIGKIRAFNDPQMIVDKPHNIYLQIGVNTGVLSLVAFLMLLVIYLVQSIRLYIKNADSSFPRLTGSGIFIGICGYLITAFFNDSVVAIAPIFWVLLGLGFACNKLSSRMNKLLYEGVI